MKASESEQSEYWRLLCALIDAESAYRGAEQRHDEFMEQHIGKVFKAFKPEWIDGAIQDIEVWEL